MNMKTPSVMMVLLEFNAAELVSPENNILPG